MENPIDNTLFAKREDEKRVVLLSSSLKTNLDKKFFDFRGKDIFKFETADVRAIKVRAGDTAWAASKKDDGWELTAPIAALANGNKIDSLLYALSGLKAKEFVSEKKSDEEIRQNGLDKPEYEARLSMPAGKQGGRPLSPQERRQGLCRRFHLQQDRPGRRSDPQRSRKEGR